MRYYEVRLPDASEPVIVTNVRKLSGLPAGTRIDAVLTDRDGSLIETWDIPVIDGKPDVGGRGKRTAQLWHG